MTLILVLLNSLIRELSDYSVNMYIEFALELFVPISGLILFFFYLKPFKRINIYFSLYFISAILITVALSFRVYILILLFMLLLKPLFPDIKKFEQNGISISEIGSSFSAPCCSYILKEKKLFLFEKTIGVWSPEGRGSIQYPSLQVHNSKESIEITYVSDFEKGLIFKENIFK